MPGKVAGPSDLTGDWRGGTALRAAPPRQPPQPQPEPNNPV